MANPVTKYDCLIKTLQTEVVSDVNNILLSKFQPIIKEITNDISIFNLIEKLDSLVKELPVFKELESKYKTLLENHKLLVDSLSNSNIQLEIKDIATNNIHDKDLYLNSSSDNSKKNVKLNNPKPYENMDHDSEDDSEDDSDDDSDDNSDDNSDSDSNDDPKVEPGKHVEIKDKELEKHQADHDEEEEEEEEEGEEEQEAEEEEEGEEQEAEEEEVEEGEE